MLVLIDHTDPQAIIEEHLAFASSLADSLSGASIALASYGDSVAMIQEFTTDSQAIRESSISSMPGTSNVVSNVLTGSSLFSTREAERVIVLLHSGLVDINMPVITRESLINDDTRLITVGDAEDLALLATSLLDSYNRGTPSALPSLATLVAASIVRPCTNPPDGKADCLNCNSLML